MRNFFQVSCVVPFSHFFFFFHNAGLCKISLTLLFYVYADVICCLAVILTDTGRCFGFLSKLSELPMYKPVSLKKMWVFQDYITNTSRAECLGFEIRLAVSSMCFLGFQCCVY